MNNGIITEITSPSREEKYTLVQVLSKGLERSSIGLDAFEFKKLHECFYHSIDGVLEVENLGCSDSIWNNSVSFFIDGKIPLHFTEGGKLSIGFGCGVDKSHCGQFPGQAPPDNENWEEYKKTKLGEIVIFLSKENCQRIPLGEALTDEKAMKILAFIIEKVMARAAILGQFEKEDEQT